MLMTGFKKASAEEKSSMFNTLLKGYQEEVDNLTKRAKFGENAFLNIYQKLYEAPDPYPVLSSVAVSSIVQIRFSVCIYFFEFFPSDYQILTRYGILIPQASEMCFLINISLVYAGERYEID